MPGLIIPIDLTFQTVNYTSESDVTPFRVLVVREDFQCAIELWRSCDFQSRRGLPPVPSHTHGAPIIVGDLEHTVGSDFNANYGPSAGLVARSNPSPKKTSLILCFPSAPRRFGFTSNAGVCPRANAPSNRFSNQ
jgi:hypothetical protein